MYYKDTKGEYIMSMAERIKERRTLKGLTQEELGKKIGLQKSAIAKYKNGRVENIKRCVIENMAEVLGCSPCYLMDWDEDPENTVTKDQILRILKYYRSLNSIGKREATKRVEELSNLPQYSKRSP